MAICTYLDGRTVIEPRQKEIEVKVFDGEAIVDIFMITREREIHKNLDHGRYRYVLDTPEGSSMHGKCKYPLLKDCYLPDFYVKGYNHAYYMVIREALPPPSYQDVKNER